MTDKYNITEIESAIVAVLREGGVSANVFTNRPRSSTKPLADFVVAHITGGVVDRCAVGECVVSFSLFAQDIENIKNAKKLSVLQDRLLSALPYEFGKVVFKPFSKRIVGDTPDGAGYHARVITIQAFIKNAE